MKQDDEMADLEAQDDTLDFWQGSLNDENQIEVLTLIGLTEADLEKE